MTVQPKDHASLSDAVRIISCAKEDVKCLNVFIHSDMEHRTERVLKRYGEIKNVGIENVLPKRISNVRPTTNTTPISSGVTTTITM